MRPEKRSIGKCIVLTIITCGIYGIFWLIKIGREAAAVKDPADRGTLEAVLLIFFPFIGTYLTEKKLYEGCRQIAFPKDDRSIVYLLLCLLVPGVGTYISYGMLQSDLNRYADALDNGFKPSAAPAGPDPNASVIPAALSLKRTPAAPVMQKADEDDVIRELRQYKELRDQNILTEEEFQTKKKSLLGML